MWYRICIHFRFKSSIALILVPTIAITLSVAVWNEIFVTDSIFIRVRCTKVLPNQSSQIHRNVQPCLRSMQSLHSTNAPLSHYGVVVTWVEDWHAKPTNIPFHWDPAQRPKTFHKWLNKIHPQSTHVRNIKTMNPAATTYRKMRLICLR